MVDGSPISSAPMALSARDRIIDALMALAAEQSFDTISISQIAERAGVSLSSFRDSFPSKGAVLSGLSRRIDRQVLDGATDALEGEPAKERLFDVLMRRLDAMAPYREGLESVAAWIRRDPLAALALNRETVNSLRFMLESAGIESEGPLGALKLQGMAFAWSRLVDVWLHDDDPGQAATMAELDRLLTRGEQMVHRVDDAARLAMPLRGLARVFLNGPRAFADRARSRNVTQPDFDEPV